MKMRLATELEEDGTTTATVDAEDGQEVDVPELCCSSIRRLEAAYAERTTPWPPGVGHEGVWKIVLPERSDFCTTTSIVSSDCSWRAVTSPPQSLVNNSSPSVVLKTVSGFPPTNR
jgi:hypothetical protein